MFFYQFSHFIKIGELLILNKFLRFEFYVKTVNLSKLKPNAYEKIYIG